jgi:hypothetical protein
MCAFFREVRREQVESFEGGHILRAERSESIGQLFERLAAAFFFLSETVEGIERTSLDKAVCVVCARSGARLSTACSLGGGLGVRGDAPALVRSVPRRFADIAEPPVDYRRTVSN